MKDLDLNFALNILQSSCNSLAELCDLTGFERFSFYQGADLSGLNLSGQDLSGMNFNGAVFYGSNLSHISFDEGAFNGSFLEEKYRYLQDDFLFNIKDVMNDDFQLMYFFVNFRSGALDRFLNRMGVTASKFAQEAGINLQTLRRARRGGTVSYETARKIAENISVLTMNLDFDGKYVLIQPLIRFIDNVDRDDFEVLDRNEVIEFFKLNRSIGYKFRFYDQHRRTSFNYLKIVRKYDLGFHDV